MKRILMTVGLLVGLIGFGSNAFAAEPIYNTFAKETFDVDTSTKQLTAANIPSGGFGNSPIQAYMTLETGDMYYTLDGSSPTATTGHLMTAGENMTVRGRPDLLGFRFMRKESTSGSLKVSYQKP
jgi:hypothetical protein